MPSSVSAISKKRAAHQMAERLYKETNFDSHECELLVNFLLANCKSQPDRLDKMKFRDILIEHFEFTDSILMDQVFKTFDTDSDGFVEIEEWVRGMSIFLRGTEDEVTKFCFDTYDMNSDRSITRLLFVVFKS